MADVAQIGFQVNTTDLARANQELDRMAREGRQVASAQDGVANKTRRSSEAFRSQRQSTQLATRAMQTFAGVLAAVGIGQTVGALVRLEKQFNRINSTLRVATGSQEGAAEAFAFVRSEARRLGQDLTSTAEQFAQLQAAARGTAISAEDARAIFIGVNEAATAMGLSVDQTRGALNAIQQIISKGNVSAEELRQQLGERLPGAFQIAARSIGVTTRELNKLLEQGELTAEDLLPSLARELQNTFGEEAENAASNLQQQINSLNTEIQLLFKNVEEDTGLMTRLGEAIGLAADELERFNRVRNRAQGEGVSVTVPSPETEINKIEQRLQELRQARSRIINALPGQVQQEIFASGGEITDRIQQQFDNFSTQFDQIESIRKNIEIANEQLERQKRLSSQASQASTEYASALRRVRDVSMEQLQAQDEVNAGVAAAEEKFKSHESVVRGHAEVLKQDAEAARDLAKELRSAVREIENTAFPNLSAARSVSEDVQLLNQARDAGQISPERRDTLVQERLSQFRQRNVEVINSTQRAANETEKYAEELRFLEQIGDRAFNRIGDAITRMSLEGQDAMTSLRNIGQAVVSELMQSFIQLAAINPLKNALFGGDRATLSGVGGLIGELIGGAATGGTAASFSAGAGGALRSTQANVPGATVGGVGFADGGSFMVDGSFPSANAGRDNRLVSFFARDGERVNVQTPGQKQSGGTTEVNVYSSGGEEPEIRRSRNGNGGERIDVILDRKMKESVASGRIDKEMRARYGITPSTGTR